MCRMAQINNLMSRKDFLKRSALTGSAAIGGGLLAGCSPDASNSQTAQQETTASSGSEPTRSDANTKVVLLGVGGGPSAKKTEHGISQAVVSNGKVYLVDCGTGVYDQLYKAGLIGRFRETERLHSVFLTHMHSDHTADYFSHLVLAWPEHPIDVYGPGRQREMPMKFAREPEGGFPTVDPLDMTPLPGVEDMTKFSTAAFAYDINLRMRDEGRPNLSEYITPYDIQLPQEASGGYDYHETQDGMVGTAPRISPFTVVPEDDNGVTITATLVDHAPVFPALAYRFDTPEGSIVISGDTSPSENLVELARGADILVHETLHEPALEKGIPEDLPDRESQLAHIYNSHTSSTKVGEVAQRADVNKLVLTHLIPGDGIVPDEVWHDSAKEGFDGEVVVGKELSEIGV